MTAAKPLAESLARGANRFNLIRLLAALAVIVSHTVSQKNGLVYELLEAATPYALGEHAVNVFFVLSGLLVAMSYERAASPADYIAARLCRIMPGLIVCSLILALVMGPMVTDLRVAAYLGSSETWIYLVKAFVLFDGDATLPGVFEHLPMADAVNAPIWTLAYEMVAYFLLLLAGMAGVFGSTRKVLAAAVIVLLAYVALELWRDRPDQPDVLDMSLRAAILYVCGVAAWHWRARLRFRILGVVVCLLVMWASNDTPVDRLIWLVATSYLALFAGTVGMDGFSAAFERLDLSYGTYLYGWPVGQLLVFLWPGISLPILTPATCILALILAFISWNVIEAPALRQKTRVAALLWPKKQARA